MAITSSAKKEIRASARKRVHNVRRMRTMRTLVKKTTKEAKGGDKALARESYKAAQQAIDKAAKRGVIKKRTAARKKAGLARAIK